MKDRRFGQEASTSAKQGTTRNKLIDKIKGGHYLSLVGGIVRMINYSKMKKKRDRQALLRCAKAETSQNGGDRKVAPMELVKEDTKAVRAIIYEASVAPEASKNKSKNLELEVGGTLDKQSRSFESEESRELAVKEVVVGETLLIRGKTQ